jgi:hypothetical protein
MDVSNDEKIKIADQIIGIREVHGVFKKGSDQWKYKFPTPNERAYIEAEVARKIGVPVENYNRNEYVMVQMCTYLDNILVESPEWWTGAGECMDETIVSSIFEKFLKDQSNFRRRLQQGVFRGPSQNKAAG